MRIYALLSEDSKNVHMSSKEAFVMDWKRKLTSRKMWLSIASFVSMLLVALGRSESDATQISAIIMAGASVVAYIIGEGLTDAASALPDLRSEEKDDVE